LLKLTKRPQTKFHAHTKLLGKKSKNSSLSQNFLQHRFLSLYRYLIKAIRADIDTEQSPESLQ